ncbi:MAG: hypothetical protein E7615_03030 [Ruminococcaceae bacterium]|nr:hypothetical protein [Oscillospiraceae bacterium]
MKKSIRILILAFTVFVMMLPLTVSAKTYKLDGTDMTVELDDSMWYVFTRDNIENNAELDELGITYDSMHSILYDNDAYMDSILFFDDGEFLEMLVRKNATDSGVANLSNYTDEEVADFAKELGKRLGIDDYSVYKSEYKFARIDYYDSKAGYYLCEFVTVVNKDVYTFTFQSMTEITEQEYNIIEDIVDNIEFDVDTSLKEKKNASLFDGVWKNALVGAVAGGCAGAVLGLIKKKKKNNNDNNNSNNVPDSPDGTAQ